MIDRVFVGQQTEVVFDALPYDTFQGEVVLEVVVEADGSVGDIKVLEDPDPQLSQAAADAVRQWRYEPAHLEDGTVVAVFMNVTVKFKLRNNCS